ncbi:hypothetical protein C163_06080 [Pseudomonas sp. FGI182]|nr:hypothetical protein C163_06080 [Pseudomonas sp. FGI182]
MVPTLLDSLREGQAYASEKMPVLAEFFQEFTDTFGSETPYRNILLARSLVGAALCRERAAKQPRQFMD